MYHFSLVLPSTGSPKMIRRNAGEFDQLAIHF